MLFYINTLVWIVQDKNKEVFEITRESLNRKAPIKTYSDDKEQIIIYTSINNGYVILLKDLKKTTQKKQLFGTPNINWKLRSFLFSF